MIIPQLLNTPSVTNYIDPGTLTMAIQILIAGAMASLFMVRGFWGRVKSFIGRLWRR